MRTPRNIATAMAARPVLTGHLKLRSSVASDVLRQASSGPTPIMASSSMPMGEVMRLK